MSDGPYAVKGYRPEYETLAAFGPLCQNDNPESICLVNTVCNEAGIDTISTGATIAFAIECFENNLLTKEDTNGIDLLWGNHEAIVELVKQIAEKRGFGGEVLFDGIEKAAEKIGKGSEEFAMHCGGEELPFHDPRVFPGPRGKLYYRTCSRGGIRNTVPGLRKKRWFLLNWAIQR